MKLRLEKLAIPNLTIWIVVLNALGYILVSVNPAFYEALSLDPAAVTRGEFYRLFTYLLIPETTSPLWIIFSLYMLYIIGSGLEAEWGSYRFNLYYFTGMLGTTLIAFFLVKGSVTNVYLNTSLFLAFATIYPNFVINLFLFLPVKVKWLGWIAAFFIFYWAASGPIELTLAAMVSVGNYFLFFWKMIYEEILLRRQVGQTRARFKENSIPEQGSFHCCCVCHKTEITTPELHFRVARDGQEYCSEHLPVRKV